MFFKYAISAYLFALALGKPVARRQLPGESPLDVVTGGATFDLSSTTISQFSASHSFDGFGGLPSLIGFDSFYGANNFCGVQNVLIREQVITCRATQVTVIQQHLAIVAEFAKKVILTQSCETEAQVVLFSQWLGNLVSFGQNLRRTNGQVPTYDANIASQLPQLVDVSGNVNSVGFDWSGLTVGSHAVSVVGDNWNNQISPTTVGITWESVIVAAGPEIPLGVECSSPVCTAPVFQQHIPPVIETIAHTTVVEQTPVHTAVVTTIVEHATVAPVHSTVVEVPVHTVIVEAPAHSTVVEHPPIVTTIVTGHVPVHETVIVEAPIHSTIQTHPAPPVETIIHHLPVTVPPVHTIINTHATSGTVVEHSVETIVGTATASTDAPVKTDVGVESSGDVDVTGVDGGFPPLNTATEASESASTDGSSTTTDAAASITTQTASATDESVSGSASASTSASESSVTQPSDDEIIPVARRARRLPPAIARRAWSSRARA